MASLTEKWTNKLFAGKGKEGETASMMEHVDAPHRPPPPPPIRVPGDDDNPYEDSRFEHDPFYLSSPELPSPPPGLLAASPLASPTSLTSPIAPLPEIKESLPPPETIRLPVSRPLTATSQRQNDPPPPVFEPEKRYCDEVWEEDSPAFTPKGNAQLFAQEVKEIETEEEDIPEQPPLIIITGAATGLGLALFQHFAARELASPERHKYDVLGIDKTAWRLPGKGFQWQHSIGKSGKFVQLDVTGSLKRLDTFAANFLYAILPSDDHAPGDAPVLRRYPRPVSLLIHCMRGTSASSPAQETLDQINAPVLRAAFDTTVVGVVQLMQTVIPHLQLHADAVRARAEEVTAAFGGSTEWLDQLRSQGSRASLQISRPLPPRDPPARAVLLGAGTGADTKEAGGRYAARASKAALGAVLKGMSVDVPEVCFASVEVGAAEMGLVNANGSEKGSFDHGAVLEELVPLMDKLGDEGLASGCFVDKSGEPVKW